MPLHPDAQNFIDAQTAAAVENQIPHISEQTPEMARLGYRALGEMLGQGEDVAVEEREITGPGSNLNLRIYRSADGQPSSGVLVFFHGGGWVIGDLDTHDHVCRALASESSSTVVAVDYRLAPESRFPSAVDDCYAALLWAAESVEALGGGPLAVGGDSAGGNLAAVVSLMARDLGGPAICMQLLVYPAVDMHFTFASIEENAAGPVLTKDHMVWFRGHYLPNEGDRGDWRASPILASSFAGLPPAHIITAEFDPLRDEGEAYGRKLSEAGVPVTVHRFDGMMHAFFQLAPLLEDARVAVKESAAALQRGFRDAR